MTTELRRAAERIRGTAKNPHLGLDSWYPVHPGDDAGIVTQRRAFHGDIIAVAEWCLAAMYSPQLDRVATLFEGIGHAIDMMREIKGRHPDVPDEGWGELDAVANHLQGVLIEAGPPPRGATPAPAGG